MSQNIPALVAEFRAMMSDVMGGIPSPAHCRAVIEFKASTLAQGPELFAIWHVPHGSDIAVLCEFDGSTCYECYRDAAEAVRVAARLNGDAYSASGRYVAGRMPAGVAGNPCDNPEGESDAFRAGGDAIAWVGGMDGEYTTCSAALSDIALLAPVAMVAQPVQQQQALSSAHLDNAEALLGLGHKGEAELRRIAEHFRGIAPLASVESNRIRSEAIVRACERMIERRALMVPQPVQQQQAKARAPKPARGERRYVTVRDSETGEIHRVLTSVAHVGVAVVIFTPSNREREGALGGMLITHDDIRKAWVFNDDAEARRMLSNNRAPGERVIRAELVADPAPPVEPEADKPEAWEAQARAAGWIQLIGGAWAGPGSAIAADRRFVQK